MARTGDTDRRLSGEDLFLVAIMVVVFTGIDLLVQWTDGRPLGLRLEPLLRGLVAGGVLALMARFDRRKTVGRS